MRIVLSSGLGPLHFVSSAKSISPLVDDFRFVCGYVPKDETSFILKLLASFRGKKVVAATKKRVIGDASIKTFECVFAEIFNQALKILDRLFHGLYKKCESFAWSIFGWQSRRYVKNADIFHVRSGAGQGGAIKSAQKRGMRVLVDHSALYPARSEQNLRDDYSRWGCKIAIAPNIGVWNNVVADCSIADMIVVNADHIKDSFVENGYDANKIRVVYLGVRRDFWGLKTSYAAHDTFHVLFTGGFVLLKGAEYVLESLRLLKERAINVHYDIVGEVGIPFALKKKYESVPITYHGQVPQDDLKLYLAESDIYLFPSLADGCAQSGMEALAAGLPVIATYQSGLPITDGVTGCVVPIKDATAIADKIEWLIAHQDERERIGREAAKMMRENYTWEKYGENMTRVYEEMMTR